MTRTKASNHVDCALIRLTNFSLLIPASCVVEIIRRKDEVADGNGARNKDQLIWKGKAIDILKIDHPETLATSDRDQANGELFVVIRIPDREKITVFSINVLEIPKLVAVHEHNIDLNINVTSSYDFAASYALLDDNEVIIPDLRQLIRSTRPN